LTAQRALSRWSALHLPSLSATRQHCAKQRGDTECKRRRGKPPHARLPRGEEGRLNLFYHYHQAIVLQSGRSPDCAFAIQNRHMPEEKARKKMNFLLLFVGGVSAALYRQSFDVGVVADGINNSSLADGAYIGGSAFVNNSEAVLVVLSDRRQYGGFHVPALLSSSLGWSASYSISLVGGTTISTDATWLTWGNTFNITTNHVFTGLVNNASFNFMVWQVDTFSNINGTAAGFFQ
jgi:hypothetical protein